MKQNRRPGGWRKPALVNAIAVLLLVFSGITGHALMDYDASVASPRSTHQGHPVTIQGAVTTEDMAKVVPPTKILFDSSARLVFPQEGGESANVAGTVPPIAVDQADMSCGHCGSEHPESVVLTCLLLVLLVLTSGARLRRPAFFKSPVVRAWPRILPGATIHFPRPSLSVLGVSRT